MVAEAQRLNRKNVVDITNKSQAFQRDAWGQAVASARGGDAKLAAVMQQGEEEAANLMRGGFAFVVATLETYVGVTWREAMAQAAAQGSTAWQAWAGPIGWTVAWIQLVSQIAAYFRGRLTPFFWSDIPFQAPGRIRAKLQTTYGMNAQGAQRVVDATFPALQVLFYAPLRGCADHAQTSLDRCRVGELTPIKNIWRWGSGGETCPEEATSRGWACFERDELADHMALSALAIAGYEGVERAPAVAGAGPSGPTLEDRVATEDQNIMRAVGNLVTGGRSSELRNYFGPGNRGGQGWTFGPAWYPPTRQTRHYGAMVYGVGVSGAVMKNSISPQQVVNQVGGASRLQDAVLVGGSNVLPSGVYRARVYRGRPDGTWRSLGSVRGGAQFNWSSLIAGTSQARSDRPRGVGFDPIGAPIQVPVQGGGISITPASRGLGYAMGTTGAGRRGGGLVGDQWRPQGVVASQAAAPGGSPAVAPVVPDMGSAGMWPGERDPNDPNVSGDELYTFEDTPLHTQLGDVGLLPLIAAAVFLS
jgi:hypothetical protein